MKQRKVLNTSRGEAVKFLARYDHEISAQAKIFSREYATTFLCDKTIETVKHRSECLYLCIMQSLFDKCL